MKIADTCPCGSAFSADDGDGTGSRIYATSEHEKWNKLHEPCREVWRQMVRP